MHNLVYTLRETRLTIFPPTHCRLNSKQRGQTRRSKQQHRSENRQLRIINTYTDRQVVNAFHNVNRAAVVKRAILQTVQMNARRKTIQFGWRESWRIRTQIYFGAFNSIWRIQTVQVQHSSNFKSPINVTARKATISKQKQPTMDDRFQTQLVRYYSAPAKNLVNRSFSDEPITSFQHRQKTDIP